MNIWQCHNREPGLCRGLCIGPHYYGKGSSPEEAAKSYAMGLGCDHIRVHVMHDYRGVIMVSTFDVRRSFRVEEVGSEGLTSKSRHS